METKLKINPKEVDFDGRSFRLIIENEKELIKDLKEKQAEIIRDLEKNSQIEDSSDDQAASANIELNP